jgi:hypothetical protein
VALLVDRAERALWVLVLLVENPEILEMHFPLVPKRVREWAELEVLVRLAEDRGIPELHFLLASAALGKRAGLEKRLPQT